MKAPLLTGLAGMALPSLAMTAEYTKRPDMQIALATGVLWIAALAYLGMASGAVSIPLARHLDWLVTTPLLLVDLGLASGAPDHEIALAVIADLLMVVAGYMAVKASATNRMVFWAAGMAFFAPVVYLLWRWHERAPKQKKPALKLTLGLWLVYPALFFMSDSKAVTQWAYAAVDVAAKAGVGALIVWPPSEWFSYPRSAREY